MALNWDNIIITDDEDIAESAESTTIFASGVPGQAATIESVTVETLPYESSATVENLGNSHNAQLKFGIPRGVPGNESINDSKGSGDTDYVWSAGKVWRELFGYPSTNLTNGADLNNFTTPGSWKIPTTAIANSLLHKPDTLSTTGKFIVFLTHNTNNLVQLIYCNNETMFCYMRFIKLQTSSNIYGKWLPVYINTNFNLTLENRTAVSSNDDLNDYTTPGQYIIATAAIAGTVSNTPVNTAGSLTVEILTQNNNSTVTLEQTYKTVGVDSHRIYRRYCLIESGTSKSFSAWEKISYDTDKKFTLDITTIENTTISSNADLNDYIVPGQYRILTSAIASTVSNIPAEISGSLTVEILTQNSGATITLEQTYKTVGVDNHKIYRRYCLVEDGTDKSFSAWETVSYDSFKALTLDVTKVSGSFISANSDLNNYTTPGQFRITTSAIAKTVSNIPVASAGSLTVEILTQNSSSTVTLEQTYKTVGANKHRIYRRYVYIKNGTDKDFSDWETVVYASDLSEFNANFVLHTPIVEKDELLTTFKDVLDVELADVDAYRTTVTAQMIYDLWDDLQSKYPNYIDAGETIGYSLDTAGNQYGPVKAYYIHGRTSGYNEKTGQNFTIPYSDTPSKEMYMYDPATPTIYMVAGTHGGEVAPLWMLYSYFARAFRSNSIYSPLLRGVKYRVVPCLDRWCIDNRVRYLAAAYNSDLTQKYTDIGEYDANRQCITTDMDHPTYATLNIASYATEATALTDYLNTHNFGTNQKDCFFDMHNCSYSLGYLATDKNNIAYKYNSMMDELARDWENLSKYSDGRTVKYFENYPIAGIQYQENILAHPSIPKSYGWFFEKAYNPYVSSIFETQMRGASGVHNEYAIAMSLDIMYRWFKEIHDDVKAL